MIETKNLDFLILGNHLDDTGCHLCGQCVVTEVERIDIFKGHNRFDDIPRPVVRNLKFLQLEVLNMAFRMTEQSL